MFKTVIVTFLLSLVIGCAKTEEEIPGGVYLSGPERQYVAENVVRVGIAYSHGPYQMINIDNEPFGMSKDYLDLVVKRTGLKVKFVPYNTFKEGFDAFKLDKTDMVLTIKQTEDRMTYASFTDPYISMNTTMLVHQLPIVIPMKVAYTEGTAVADYLQTMAGSLQLIPMPDAETGFKRLMSDELGAIVVDVATADFLEAKYETTFSRSPVNFVYEFSMAYQKPNAILGLILQKGLAAITNEEDEAIRSRWLTKQTAQQVRDHEHPLPAGLKEAGEDQRATQLFINRAKTFSER